MDNIWLAFLTGLTTGGISCLTVQGGLLASAGSQISSGTSTKLVGSFLVGKITAYTLLGFALGFLGSKLTLTASLQGWMQIAAGIFMLATAGRLLDLHPIFRYTVIQPPKWALRLLRKNTKSEAFFAPGLLGFLTLLIPCGVTQAMMVLAITTGSPFLGAAILFAFTLGTSPIFFALGMAAVQFLQKKSFAYLAALIIAALGLLSINSGQVLRGSFHTIQNYYKVATVPSPSGPDVAATEDKGKQQVTINVTDSGYKSSVTTLKAGVPVVLTLNTSKVQSCARAFVIPSMNISKVLPESGTTTLEFTPKTSGSLAFSCSMGMYSGTWKVI
jgi:uncharacterized protein